MNIKSFIIELKNSGIDLNLLNSKIIIDAPKGIVSEDVLSMIKYNKSEIISYLSNVENYKKYYSIEPSRIKEYYALSSAQKRIYFLQEIDLDSTAYNMPMVLPLGKNIDKHHLENTLKSLIERHESLRTSFEKVNDEVMQNIHERVDFNLDYYEATEEESKKIITSFVKPFDLSKVPLIRSGLIKLLDGHHVWLVDLHHIISDGTSQGVLTEDFISIYSGLELEPLKLDYKDFSEWQNNLIESGLIKQQEKYWLDLYSVEIPRLNLPTDYKRPSIFNYSGCSFSFMLDKCDSIKLRKQCSSYGGTLYMNILTILNVLFYKYTGQEDIVIGCVVAGRQHIDLQRIIGMFVNTLAMRNHPSGDKSYKSLLKEVISNSVKAFENQDVQFEDLVDKIGIERDSSRNPLFDIMMGVQNFRHANEGENITIKNEISSLITDRKLSTNYSNLTSKFDMTFYVHEIGDDIFISIEYYTGIFKRQTVEQLSMHFQKLVKEVVSNPEILLSEIDIIISEEKHKILYGFNNTATDYPIDKTIHQLFKEQVSRTPDNVAIAYKDQKISYRELDGKSSQIANYLISGGVLLEHKVGILMDRSIEIIVCIFGILKAGCCYLPIDPENPYKRIIHMLTDTSIGIVFSQKRYIKDLNKLQWDCPSFHTFVCMDSTDVYSEQEYETSELMSKELWHHVGETATDEITGGGWNSSYTGEPIPLEEMNEYGENNLKKVEHLLHKQVKVLEIGSASGITMFRIAPLVGSYIGTDLSEVIIESTRLRAKLEGHRNIHLYNLAAHETNQLKERDFDLIIINSVIQCFNGHNYLHQVIKQSLSLLKDKGYMFLGDIMDLDKKEYLIQDMTKFRKYNQGLGYKTKVDWSEELFISKSYWGDLKVDFPEIKNIEFSDKIYSIENELTKFRYDVLITINKKINPEAKNIVNVKNKYQYDANLLKEYNSVYPNIDVSSNNLAYIIYTSGTTGKPKGVMVEHLNITRVVRHTSYINIQSNDKILQLSNYAFDGSVFDIYGALLNGAALIMIQKEVVVSPYLLTDFIRENEITVMFITTALFNIVVDISVEAFENVRKILFGGERVSIEHCRKALKYLGENKLIHVYGPTESTVFATYHNINQIDEFDYTIPIGRPISNTTAYIFNEANDLSPIGVLGELHIGGEGLSRGYLNDMELSSENFIWCSPEALKQYKKDSKSENAIRLYKTGDIARWLPNGSIEFSGRLDSQVKIRGFRIELGEIEAQLLKLNNIKDAVVIVKKDEYGEKYIVGYLVSNDGEELEISNIRNSLSKNLPDYMIPSFFVEIENIPLTVNGKVDKKSLPASEITVCEDYIAPSNEIEVKLVEIWSEVLKIDKEKISVNANFFELGGHSLKATVLTSKIHEELDVKIPLADIFETPSIIGMSKYIEAINVIDSIVIEENIERTEMEI